MLCEEIDDNDDGDDGKVDEDEAGVGDGDFSGGKDGGNEDGRDVLLVSIRWDGVVGIFLVVSREVDVDRAVVVRTVDLNQRTTVSIKDHKFSCK